MASIKYCSCSCLLFLMYKYFNELVTRDDVISADRKWSPTANDLRLQMIPKMDWKWSWTANNSHCRRQVIPWKVEEWNGFQAWMMNVLRTLQRLPLTRALEGIFLSVETWVFVDVNQLFPWFSHALWREGSLIIAEWTYKNNFEWRRRF